MTPDTPVGVRCSVLEWDSEFFGCRIASIDAAALGPGAAAGSGAADGPEAPGGADRFAAVDQWCASQGVRCAYLLLAADDDTTIAAAQANGFRLVDVRVTLGRTLEMSFLAVPSAKPPSTLSVRAAVPADIPALRAIARESHKDTRFYADRHFDRSRCDQLYDLWIDKSCRGWAEHVVVAAADGTPVGYVSCHLRDSHGQIGLVGVEAASRGQGLGSAMIEEAYRWFAGRGIRRVTIVTQGRNTGGLRLYQKRGMTVEALQLWFHKWF